MGRGPTEVDNGREAAGAFRGEKKFVEEIFSGDDWREGAGGIPVSRTGNWIRTVACGFTPGCDGFVTGGWGNWIRTVSFLGWSGSAIRGGGIDQKSWTCHEPILQVVPRNTRL